MAKRNIIVIGASAGGFEPIKRLIGLLPKHLDVSIFIVWHMAAGVRGILPDVLNRIETNLPAGNAIDGEEIKPGKIYVAPPDRHLLIEDGKVRVTHGPKENHFRPAIDPLFRSAALHCGSRVIGIILSGALDDGTAGLWAIKDSGGIAIVQHPDDAEVSSMPENAIRSVVVDHIVPVSDMGRIIIQECSKELPSVTSMNEVQKTKTEREVNIAMEHKPLDNRVQEFGNLTPYTCPECHGVLSSIKEGGRLRFRCHTGHAFSSDTLLANVSENIEAQLWSAIRIVQESVFLLNHMGDHFAEVNEPKIASVYFRKAKDAERRAEIVRSAVMEHETLSLNAIMGEYSQEADVVARESNQASQPD